MAGGSLRRVTKLSAALLAFSSAACVSVPHVTIDHAEVKSVSLDGVDLGVFLAVHNDNVFDIKIRRVHAEATIAHTWKLDPVDMTPDVWVPSNDKIILAVDVSVPWSVMPAILESTVSEGSVTYRMVGDADVTATRALGIEEDHYAFDQEGSLLRSVFLNLSPGGIHLDIGGGGDDTKP